MIGLEQVKKHWDTPAKIAVWLTALIGLFVLPLPRLWPSTSELGATSDPTQWLRLSQFLVAIVVGLFFLRPRKVAQRIAWRPVAIGAALLGVALFVGVQFVTPAWTCGFIDEVVVRGAGYLPGVATSMPPAALADCSRMIALATGETSDLWPEHEIVTRFVILAAIYTLTVLAFAIAALATIESVRLSQPPSGDEGEG